jgi:hypothetical protein
MVRGAFWQPQFLGMTHNRPARILFEWCSHSVNVLCGCELFQHYHLSSQLLSRSLQSCLPTSLYTSWRHSTVSINPEFLAKIHVGRQSRYRCYYKMILRRKHAVKWSTTTFQTWTLFTATPPGSIIPLYLAHAKNRKKRRCQKHAVKWSTTTFQNWTLFTATPPGSIIPHYLAHAKNRKTALPKSRCEMVHDYISKLNAIHGHATWQQHSPSPITLKIEKTALPNRPIYWRALYILIIKTNKMKVFSNLFRLRNLHGSGKLYCPSSGVSIL